MRFQLSVLAAFLVMGAGLPAMGQQLVAVVPDHAAPGESLEITISGDSDVFFTSNSVVTFSPAGSITHGTVESLGNALVTTINITPETPPGMQDVSVLVDGTIEYTGQDLFEVRIPQSTGIASVTPDSAPAGTSPSLTIAGSNTHFGASSVVEFSGTGIQVDSVDALDSLTLDVEITIAGDAPRTARTVTVTTDQEVATGSGAFTVTAPPVTLNPSSGTQGQNLASVSLSGGPGGYSASTDADLGEGITIGSVDAPDGNTLVLTNVAIAANAPVGPRALILTSPDEVLPDAFTVLQGAGTQLLSVDPAHGDRGHPGLEVSLVGQNTHFDDPEVEVSLADTGIWEVQPSASDPENLSITLIIEDTATEGLHDVTVTVGESGCSGCEKVSLADGFEVTAPGSLDSADPDFITAGESASVSITATDGQFVQGQTSLTFEPPEGIEVTSLTVVDADHLTVDIQTDSAAPGDARSVRAVSGTEVAVGVELIDIYNPEILGLTPNVGQQGMDLGVTVFGVDIPFDAETQVTFSGTGIVVNSVSFEPEEPDQVKLQVSVAANAPLGKREVTVDAQGVVVTLAEGFTVKPPWGNGGDDNGGCSCSGGSPASVLLVVILLGLMFFRRRRKAILPPSG